jgi:alkylhydroperoxidase family enzyme
MGVRSNERATPTGPRIDRDPGVRLGTTTPSAADRYRLLVDDLTAAVLERPGYLPAEVRQSVVARASNAGSSVPEGLPASAANLVDLVVSDAARVQDDDIDRLRSGGLNEEAILELVIAAALGAGLERLSEATKLLQAES